MVIMPTWPRPRRKPAAMVSSLPACPSTSSFTVAPALDARGHDLGETVVSLAGDAGLRRQSKNNDLLGFGACVRQAAEHCGANDVKACQESRRHGARAAKARLPSRMVS
jgi:hypothetical protein